MHVCRVDNIMEVFFPTNSASCNCNDGYRIRLIISHASLVLERDSAVSCSHVSYVIKSECYVYM